MANEHNKKQTILVTGCAGFIGSKISELLLERGDLVIGVDNLNDAYPPPLKEWRLAQLQKFPAFEFERLDITHFDAMKELFQQHKFDAVMNLAARAGVRASVENPWVYVETNITGTLNLLELCSQGSPTTSSYGKDFGVKKFLLASTSSIYGENEMPFREDQKTDFQLSPYAASKKGAESLAYTYHYLYGIDISIPRYFTVFGPAGRPDMSIFKFIHRIAEGLPIPVYGDGTQERDFTYIDDIARGSIAALKPLPSSSGQVGFEVINLGSDRPVKLNYVINLIEQCLGKKAQIDFQPRHPADVPATWFFFFKIPACAEGRQVKGLLMKVIIPAAGAGTRLRPHTHTIPKTLVQVAGKPILGHILDRLSVLDVTELILIIGYMGEKMKAVPIDGWYDCGKPESLLATNRYLLQK